MIDSPLFKSFFCFNFCSILNSQFFLVALMMFLLVFAGCADHESSGGMVRINEFLASNDTGITDEDGDHSDWIELHNTGNEPVELGGWYLTDDKEDLVKWMLPSETISPGGFLVVFASKKDRSGVIGEQHHTNFKLSSAGEYLALIKADGSTIADEYTSSYPPQTSDVSYGYTTEGVVSFLELPTPGAANSAEALAKVKFSRSSGVFSDSLSLAMSLESNSGREGGIYYTTDGSMPTPASALYSAPLVLTKSTVVRARVFDGAQEHPGPDNYAFFTAVDRSVAERKSDLALVVIDTLGAVITNEDGDGVAAITVVERVGGVSTVASSAEYSGGASIRIRGSSSAKFPKKQFKLELQDAQGSGVDKNLLNLGKESDWILYAPGFYDRNMIANPLMQRLAGEVGLTEMQSRFVELYVNEDGGSVGVDDYRGIYTLGESIKIGEKRVDIKKLSLSDQTEPEITGGYIVSIDRYDDDKYHFKTELDVGDRIINRQAINVFRPKLNKLADAQKNWIESYINEFEAALVGPDRNDPERGYRAYIDAESWIDSHLLKLFSKDVDMLVLSHYLVVDRGERIRSGPLWDSDRSLTTTDQRYRDPTVLWASDGSAYPFEFYWWRLLFDDPQFVTQYRKRWNELRAGPLATEAVLSNINDLAAEIASTYPHEVARWGHLPGYGSRYTDFAGEIIALKDWVVARLVFLDFALYEPL